MRPLFLAALLAFSWLHGPAPARAMGTDVVVALLDTGVYADHQEFDYRGASSADDQVVAWWDFTNQLGPARHPSPGMLWDTRAPDPYDGHGHGTSTAAVAVGLNRSASKTRAFAPGFKLAVAKVGRDDGTIDGNIGAAIRWATDTAGAKVINISIGSITPSPRFLSSSDYAAITHARSRGVLVVVANGNGFANRAIPGDPGWANAYGSSPNVLSVGAAGPIGALVSTDPEVAADFGVTSACPSSPTCYWSISGTSFSSPLVAGMGAAAMKVAADNGQDASAGQMELLLKRSAFDSIMPPNTEGYGILDGIRFEENVLPHAAAGTLPQRPSPDLSGLYVEAVAGNLRAFWP